MKTTLTFPSYLHLSGFLSVADNSNIDMDLLAKSLSAVFSERDIHFAISQFDAVILSSVIQ